MIGHEFPYLDTRDLNLDWLIKNMKQILQDWATYQQNMNQSFASLEAANAQFKSDMTTAFNTLHDFVDDYFDNLDVQQEINNKLNAMKRSGELAEIMDPLIASETADWLAEHITNPSSPPVDTSLSVSGAAADAKVTGDNFKSVNRVLTYDKELLQKILPVNQVYMHNITDGYFVAAASGILIANASFAVTDYIDLTGYSKIVLSDGTAQFAYYDSSKAYVSGVGVPAGLTAPTEYTIPNNVKYARFSIDKGVGSGLVFLGSLAEYTPIANIQNLKTTQTNVAEHEYYLEQVGNIIPINRILAANNNLNCYVNSDNGNLVNSQYFNSTDYINVTGSSKVILSAGVARFAYYDANYTYISGNSTPTLETATEFSVPATAVYARFSLDKSYIDHAVYLMTMEAYKKFYAAPVFIVGANENFTKLKDGIAEAVKYPNAKVIVRAGTYDLIEEFGNDYFENMGTASDGIVLRNGVNVLFEEGALVTCHYTGSNENVINHFSPFFFHGEWLQSNVLSEIDGFTLHNLRLDASNTRYAIHDEAGGKGVPYKNVYDHCEITFDGTNLGQFPQAIGGGLGQHGEIVIKDCILSSEPPSATGPCNAASYHNNSFQGGNVTDLSSIIVSGCAFVGERNTLRLGYIGAATEKTKCLCYGNLFHAEPFVAAEQASAQNVNMELIAYSNTVVTE